MNHGRKRPFVWLTAILLSAVMLLSLCTGCGKPRPGIVEPPSPPDPINQEKIIDTYNVALVLDTSGTMMKSDSSRIALLAPVMFLDSMFAGNANKERMPGARHANVNIITYNDKATPLFKGLQTLDDVGTVVDLSSRLRDTYHAGGTNDTALGEALEMAVDMLPDIQGPLGPGGGPGPVGFPSPGPMAFPAPGRQADGGVPPGSPPPPPGGPGGAIERNLIILLTDGYSSGSASAMSYGNANTSGQGQGGYSGIQRVTLDAQNPEAGSQFPIQEQRLPQFGSPVQQPLERALKAAKNRNCEIFVLGLNSAGELTETWEEFKQIANYTQLQMGPPPGGPMLGMDPANAPGMITNGQEPGMIQPPPPPPPIRQGQIGGGLFTSTDSDGLVNYRLARDVVDCQQFFIQMAAAMLQGSGVQALPAGRDLANQLYRYDCDVKGNGITAAVFYILSSNLEVVTDDMGNLVARSLYFDMEDPDGYAVSDTINEAIANHAMGGWDSSEKVRVNWYESYATVTVVDPKPGVWKLYAKTTSGDNSSLAAYMVQVGGIDLVLSFRQNEKEINVGDIILKAQYQGIDLERDFYQNATAVLNVMGPPPGGGFPPPVLQAEPSQQTMGDSSAPQPGMTPPPPPAPIQMVYNEEQNAMVAEYEASEPGSYMVEVELTASDVPYRCNGSITFEAKPGEDVVLRGTGKTVKLVPSLKKPWSDIELTVQSWRSDPRGLVSVERDRRNAQRLVVKGEEAGEGTLYVTVSGPSGQQWTIPYTVQVG